MIFRFFIVVIGLCCALMAYDSARLMLIKSSMRDADGSYVMTSPQADLTVVEFLDYSCPKCQKTHPIILKALERDGRIRYIPRPGAYPESPGMDAAKLAYAAGRQGKFMDAHMHLIENFRVIDEAYIDTFALKLELDATQLHNDYKDPELIDIVSKNKDSLIALKGASIPTFLIGNKIMLNVLRDLPTTEELLSLFNKARAL